MHALAAEFSPSIMQVNNRYSCFLHSNSFCTRPAESHSNVSHFSIGFGLGNRPWTSICFVANEITEVNRSFVWWKAKWEGGGRARLSYGATAGGWKRAGGIRARPCMFAGVANMCQSSLFIRNITWNRRLYRLGPARGNPTPILLLFFFVERVGGDHHCDPVCLTRHWLLDVLLPPLSFLLLLLLLLRISLWYLIDGIA